MIALLLIACNTGFEPRSLEPYPNPYGADEPYWAAQPPRDHPQEVVSDGSHLWVSLPGTPDAPGHEVARVDPSTGTIERVDTEGSGPVGLALHPDGERLVVFNRFSNFATVIDVGRQRVTGLLPTDFYAVEGVFSPDGDELWVSNRWRDAVVVHDLDDRRGRLSVTGTHAVPVGTNPRDLALSADGSLLAVAALTGLTVSIVDRARREELHRIDLRSPANDVAFVGAWLVVATTSASTHHPASEGPDGDGDGAPGDGTPNVNFQDLQNELVVIDPAAGAIVHRYTSDTLCCRDYRDVDPRDGDREGDLLPDAETWIVGGALPEQLVADEDGVWVSYVASNQLQRFALDPADGALTPGPVVDASGHAPHGLALHGGDLYVAHRLGETLGRYGPDGTALRTFEVGDLSGGAFPATDAEIGELFNVVTAPFTIDGDTSCTHCHREDANIDKAFSMPLTRRPGLGLRMTMAYRGAADSRPWFHEAAFDESNFFPVMNELARIENFCCTDYTLFPGGAPADCEESPPPECTTEPNAGSLDGFRATRDVPFPHERPAPEPTRDTFYLARAAEVIGRTESFGDAVYQEDPITGERRPVPLDFDGITRALGVFLLTEPRLLPNPNPETDATRRGEALFARADVGCIFCHPGPAFAVTTETTTGLPLRMAPVVSPFRDEDAVNLDLYAQGFVDTFPRAEMDACEDVCDVATCEADDGACDDLRDVYLGVPPLRGIWDRADGMLHHGRARGLREVLATPGHPALRDGERGFNELDGIPDSHGGTSHLDARELEDLAAYLRTL